MLEQPKEKATGLLERKIERLKEVHELTKKRVPLLDKGWIELQDVMGDDLAIVSAARASFLGESKGDKQDKRLLNYLMKHKHTSPFEMVEFKFRVRAPLLTWWQWVRHRTWNYNAQSGRYTPFQENDFYTIDSDKWRKQSEDNKQGSDGFLPEKWDGISSEPTCGDTLTRRLLHQYKAGFDLYEQALAAGVAKEQARLFLPGFAVYYTWVCKVDAHNLMHFLSLRMAPDAQYEIRVYAEAIYEHFFKPVLPWTAEAFDKKMLRMKNNNKQRS